MRLRIVELLLVVAVVGVTCTALKVHTPLVASCYFTATCALLGLAGVLAIARVGSRRAFWVLFVGGSYLCLVHIPDEFELSPRHAGSELTTQLLRLSQRWILGIQHHTLFDGPVDSDSTEDRAAGPFVPDPNAPNLFATDPSDSGGFFNVQDAKNEDEEVIEEFQGNLSLVFGSGEVVMPGEDGVAFMRIGHSAWALLLAWLAGHLCRIVYTKSRRSNETQE